DFYKILLWLLLCNTKFTAGNSDCSSTRQAVTVQLSRADVLRTWQPSGAHCRWWESRQSETNRFPAAVRSGPRWLVMQLRQPMMLEAVSVRDWDGQWLAAAPVGSPESAVGASSLPLELQLEDPCRASWEAFGSSDRWRQIGVNGVDQMRQVYVRNSINMSLTEVKSEFVVTVTSAMLNGTQDGFSSTHRLNIMKQEQKTDWLRPAPQPNHHQFSSSQSVSRGGPPPAESSSRGNENEPTSSQETDPVYEEVSLCVYRPVHPLPRYPRQFSEKHCRRAHDSSRFD
uniref:Vitellogenin domain-containing protein n=1 Tax=Macrostomum lignano TaxID=282301 RepID=A0A1I8GTN4_9PLAT